MSNLNKSRGFTLIEIMVVVAIVGIIVAIAMPSYQSHILRTRRVAATGCLVELTQFMERYYTSKMTYIGATIPSTSCSTELTNFYTFQFATGSLTASAYTIEATRAGGQVSDSECGDLTLNQTGARTPTTASCWK